MGSFRVSVKYGKDSTDLSFDDATLTIGGLRDAIEAQMSVPLSSQSLICAGKRWQGIAFGDDLKVLEAAGPKGTKEVDGVKVVSLMLMAPPGADGSEQVARLEAQINDAGGRLAAVPSGEGARKELLAIADDIAKASEALDVLKLVGAQRERRRLLLTQIDELEGEVNKRKANL